MERRREALVTGGGEAAPGGAAAAPPGRPRSDREVGSDARPAGDERRRVRHLPRHRQRAAADPRPRRLCEVQRALRSHGARGGEGRAAQRAAPARRRRLPRRVLPGLAGRGDQLLDARHEGRYRRGACQVRRRDRRRHRRDAPTARSIPRRCGPRPTRRGGRPGRGSSSRRAARCPTSHSPTSCTSCIACSRADRSGTASAGKAIPAEDILARFTCRYRTAARTTRGVRHEPHAVGQNPSWRRYCHGAGS